jgi:iron complex transport system substrate-binding protein
LNFLTTALSSALIIASVSGALAQDFPVTVTHERGETTIPAKPERIVSVGLHEQDFLYALGLAPVGVHEWWGDYAYGTWPWAEEARAAVGATPEVLKAFEINVEWVAAQHPDLIVATYYGDLDDATYDLLSQIAPTITAPPGFPAWGAPWQAELQLIGEATGTSAKAEEIVAEIEAKFAEAKAEWPTIQGKTAAIGYDQEGVIRTYNSADTAHRFMTSLGMVIPPEYDVLAADRGHIDISAENIELAEVDAFVWPDGPGSIADLSIYQNSRLAKEGRSIDLGGGVPAAAISFQTPLSLGYLIDAIPPLLAAAVDGDPATPIPALATE